MACMAFDRGRPRFVFGTMGADGQPQTNIQVLHKLLGAHPQEAVAAPRVLHGRFLLEDDAEALRVESGFDAAALAALEASPTKLEVMDPRDERLGHPHAITLVPDGTVAVGVDPRSDGLVEMADPGG